MHPIIKTQRRKRQGGNVLIEFSLMATVLLLMTFGVTDFAKLFYTADMVASAACAGTQYGALSPAHYGDMEGMQTAALADAQNPPGMTAVATQFCACSVGGTHMTCPATCNGGGSPETYIQVDVQMPFDMTFAVPGLPNTTNVTSRSIVRVQ